jgi:hypothetical protein
MARSMLLVLLILVAGCGSDGGGGSPAAPANPFAPYVGTWDVEVTAVAGVYDTQYDVGDHKTATISTSGVVTTTDAGGATVTYQLTKVGGTFTATRPVTGGTETLNASFTDGSNGGAVLQITSSDHMTVVLRKTSSSG